MRPPRIHHVGPPTPTGASGARTGGALAALARALAWPLRWIRGRLRQIDYYSARRERDAWSRSCDGWIVASIPVSVIVVLLVAMLLRQEERVLLALGVLEQGRDGGIEARLVLPGQQLPAQGRFLGALEVMQQQRSAGWPLPIWSEVGPLMLVVDMGLGRREMALESDAEEAAAARSGLACMELEGRPGLLESVPREGGGLRTPALIASIAVTWLGVMPIGLLAIRCMRGLQALVAGARELRRLHLRASGRCEACGYDLTGSEFSAACPECGSILG